MQAIKLLFVGEYVANGSTNKGVFAVLWETIKIALKQLKYLPDLLAQLPWWAVESIMIFLLLFGLLTFDKIKEKIDKNKKALWERYTRGKFKI